MLIVLFICMSIVWLFDSDYWYNIVVFMVVVFFILYGVNDYIVGKNKV